MPDTPDVPPTSPSQPATPAPSSAAKVVPVKKLKTEQPLDPAHVPMTEEFDRPRWTLPPMKIVGIGVAIVAVIAAILIFANRATPVVGGGITNVSAVTMQDNTVLVAVQLHISNVTPKQWYIDSMKGTVKTAQGDFSDDAAAAVDSQRYFQAFPALAAAGTDVLKFDQKLAPGQQETGTVVFAFPITKDQFDQRKSLTVTIQPFDNLPVTFTK